MEPTHISTVYFFFVGEGSLPYRNIDHPRTLHFGESGTEEGPNEDVDRTVQQALTNRLLSHRMCHNISIVSSWAH